MTGDNTSVTRGHLERKRDGTITASFLHSVGNVGAYADHSMFAIKFAPVEATEVAFAPHSERPFRRARCLHEQDAGLHDARRR